MSITLNPLLVDINTQMNDTGIQKNTELWFYTTYIAYQVSVYNYKYYVTRVSKSPSEWIPLVESGGEADVFAILRQEPVFLTADEVAVQWAAPQNYCG